jgi:hypothetical protein
MSLPRLAFASVVLCTTGLDLGRLRYRIGVVGEIEEVVRGAGRSAVLLIQPATHGLRSKSILPFA